MQYPLWLVVGLAVVGCAVPRAPAALPPTSEGYVAVFSGEMPGGLSQVARHAWIVVNVPGKGLRRFELGGGGGGDPFDYFGRGEVAVHGVIRYEPAELERKMSCLRREQRAYREQYPQYFAIPGPNSNTIVDYLLRHCDIHVELPATAIGRDYRGLIGASVTSRGTGVQLETWPLGVKLGIEEGVELHLLDMAWGLHFWPPGITVPVNPGRVGFDTDMHRDPQRDSAPEPRERNSQGEYVREYGAVSLWMWSHYARVLDPTRASSVEHLATVGFNARAAYGTRLGYGMGFDLEGGLGIPTSFSYAARLYPVGLVLMLHDNTFIGLFSGVGSNGVTAHVPARLELPNELSVEVDVSSYVRVGALANIGWYPGSSSRSGGSLVSPFADQLLLSAFVRLGRAEPCGCGAAQGRGYFLGLSRGELMGSAWLGANFGVEADFGY
jgi:hypothetical protein